MSKLDLIIGPVNLEDLLDRLTFSEQTLPTAVLEQAKLYMESVRFRVSKMRRRQAAELELEQTKAKLAMGLRRALAAAGKVTEGMISERLDASMKLGELRKAVNDAEQLEEWAKGMQDALRMRRDMIQVYARLVSTDADMRIKESDVGSLARKRDKLRSSALNPEDA